MPLPPLNKADLCDGHVVVAVRVNFERLSVGGFLALFRAAPRFALGCFGGGCQEILHIIAR